MTMKTTVNVTCDGEICPHVRTGDSNHWLVGIAYDRFVALAYNRARIRMMLATLPSLPDDCFKDFCGEQCAIKWVSKQLTEIQK
jgi:hypothetical protein